MSRQNTEERARKVTIGELNDKLDVVNAQQKAEHTKTRALVIIVGIPSIAVKALTLFGYVHMNLPGFH